MTKIEKSKKWEKTEKNDEKRKKNEKNADAKSSTISRDDGKGRGVGNEQYYMATLRKMLSPRRLVPGTLRWTSGRTWVRHQPPSGQHRCLRCCRRSGLSSAPWSRSSTLCLWSRCFTTLCRRWWNSWWTFSHLSISVLPSRLSKYPRSCPPRAARTVLRGPQTADQLVEVPTIISYSSLLQRTPAAWLNTEDEPFQWCFRTFSPEEKSANVTRHMGARVPRHVSSSTSSAYGPRTWVDDGTGEVWTLLTDPALGSWWYSSRTHRSQWHPPGER